MTLRRGLLLLAMLTALIGAPSAALAAPPNQLLAPTATPAAGTTSTTFVLSVAYASAGGNAATAVTATVAGRTLAMSRSVGSATHGVWTVTTALPAGSWPVTFHATTQKGPEPSVGGVTVSVASIVPPPTPRGPDPTPTKDVEGDGDAPTPTPAEAPVSARPSSSPGAAIDGSSTPSAAGAPAPANGGESGASSGGVVTAPTGDDAAAGPGDPNVPASPVPSSAAPEAPGTGSSGPEAGRRTDVVAVDSTTIWTIMVGGLAAVAAVALLGSAWLFLGRRRDGEDPEPVTAPDGPAAIGRGASGLRSRRRALREAAEDPVLAAMGLDQPAADRPRASQVHRGTAMRDATRPPRTRR